jgi:ankyrin repeat protein
VLNALLDRNVDLNKADSCGNTAMHLSIIYEHKDVTEMLIDHRNINLRLQNNDGLTPFATALRVKNTKAAERFFLILIFSLKTFKNTG